jgi:hypothetical protein
MCSLTEIDILNIVIKDVEYNQTIMDGVEKRDTFKFEMLIDMLSKHNYVEEFAEQKAFEGIKEAIGLRYFKNDPILKSPH